MALFTAGEMAIINTEKNQYPDCQIGTTLIREDGTYDITITLDNTSKAKLGKIEIKYKEE